MWHSDSVADELIGRAFRHLLCVCACARVCVVIRTVLRSKKDFISFKKSAKLNAMIFNFL